MKTLPFRQLQFYHWGFICKDLRNYTKRKHLRDKLDGFIASVDWWNATYVYRVELSESYYFWKILENIWNRYECGRFLKALPLSRWNGVMTLTLTDQWPGMPSNYMRMVFKNLSGKLLLEKEEASFLTM